MRAELYFLPKGRPPDGVGPGEHEDVRPTSSPAQRTALVVEDEWLVRAEIADALMAAGWAVIEAASGEDAIETVATETAVDLLVTDIRLLGKVNGWDVAEAFRASKPEGLVVYASANAAVVARQVPGSVFVDKPTRMNELVSVGEALWRSVTSH